MLKKYFLFCVGLFCFSLVNAENFDDVKVLSVYDGDTFKVNLPCSEDIFCKDISIRIYGIDTPEIKTQNACEKKKAKQAQALTQNILNRGPVILNNCKRDKYFRLLCNVSVLGQNQGYDVAGELLDAGLAVRYYGQTKADIDWCKMPNNTKQNTFKEELLEVIKTILAEIINFIKNL